MLHFSSPSFTFPMHGVSKLCRFCALPFLRFVTRFLCATVQGESIHFYSMPMLRNGCPRSSIASCGSAVLFTAVAVRSFAFSILCFAVGSLLRFSGASLVYAIPMRYIACLRIRRRCCVRRRKAVRCRRCASHTPPMREIYAALLSRTSPFSSVSV